MTRKPSFRNRQYDYKIKDVTDPQGQCIIGGVAECLVKDNTLGKRGELESVRWENKYCGASTVA
jgi:hypothetical protein